MSLQRCWLVIQSRNDGKYAWIVSSREKVDYWNKHYQKERFRVYGVMLPENAVRLARRAENIHTTDGFYGLVLWHGEISRWTIGTERQAWHVKVKNFLRDLTVSDWDEIEGILNSRGLVVHDSPLQDYRWRSNPAEFIRWATTFPKRGKPHTAAVTACWRRFARVE